MILEWLGVLGSAGLIAWIMYQCERGVKKQPRRGDKERDKGL